MKDQDTSQRLSSATGGGVPLTYVIALVPVASVLNVIGGTVAGALKLPIFLDMIGTAVVAMTIGPWWGALVGVITNVTSGFITGPVSIPFAACNVVGALIWGYGTKWGWANDKLKFFGLFFGLHKRILSQDLFCILHSSQLQHLVQVQHLDEISISFMNLIF